MTCTLEVYILDVTPCLGEHAVCIPEFTSPENKRASGCKKRPPIYLLKPMLLICDYDCPCGNPVWSTRKEEITLGVKWNGLYK